MSANIDVITGFLESGKTSFIKEILNSENTKVYEKILILVCEEGIESYEETLTTNKNVSFRYIENPSAMNRENIKNLLEEEEPDYVIIEYNGTWDINLLLDMKIPVEYEIRNILFLSEADKFYIYFNNMTNLLWPHIRNSNCVIINRHDFLNKKEKKDFISFIKNINPKIDTVFYSQFHENKIFNKLFIPFDKYDNISLKTIMLASILIILCFLPNTVLGNLLSYLPRISDIFFSIMIQAIPFILLGAFVSSFIQIVISSSWISKQISKHNVGALLLSSVLGFFFPACDCGLVPLVNGLLKKNTPLPQVITFWLTSAAVNPIVIVSVLYAFPDKPYLAVMRVVLGVAIGLITGFILLAAKINTRDVIRSNSVLNMDNTDMIVVDKNKKYYKVKAIFQGAKIEFFRVFKYVIIGAFLSSLSFVLIPKSIFTFMGNNPMLQYLAVFMLAVFMSTCSTSNAFIGRSLYGNFSLASVLSFMTLGPMLDFKNVIILSGVLKKRFIIELIALVGVIGLLFYGVLNTFI